MENKILIAFIYLLSGFLLSFIISYCYLRHYPTKETKGAFRLAVFIFGLIIFFIFLIPFDIASSALAYDEKYLNKFLDCLPTYYLVFGYFSQTMGDVICPIMILIETSGYYRKWDITKDVIKRFLSDYLSVFKLVVVTVISIPTISYFVTSEIDIFEFLRNILLYLNFFPYLEMLFYIGFVCQDFVYSYLRKSPLYKHSFDIWKLGKLYKYYEREKLIVNSRAKKIEDIIKRSDHSFPYDFNKNYKKFKMIVYITQTNLLTFEFSYEDIKKMKQGTNDYKKQKDMAEMVNLNEGNNYINSNESDPFNDWIEQMFFKVENDEERLRRELGSNYDYLFVKKYKNNGEEEDDDNLDNENVGINSDLISSNRYEDWESFKNRICDLMTEVIESSVSLQRKSFLLSKKSMDILKIEGGEGEKRSSAVFIPIILFYIILFLLEMPWSIYEWIPKYFKKIFFGNICISLSSIIFYFYIFNYAIIHHKHMSGDLLFGKNNSGSVNFYNFISYVLGNCDAAFYHSIWTLRKYKVDEDEIGNNDDYDFFPKYFDVFELPELYYKGIDIIRYTSIIIIIISIFNSAKFSILKIRRKEICLFNENSDFFYNEQNLYTNYILGVQVLIQEKKKLDFYMAKGILPSSRKK